MSETRVERLEQANRILALFEPELRLEERRGRLWLVYDYAGNGRRYHAERAAVLNRSGNSLACRYGVLGIGGTSAQAVAQLVRWIRDDTRLPLPCWWWCGRTVDLAQGEGQKLMAALEATSYGNPAKTGCIFCGSAVTVDWWSRDGDPTGPCCSHSGCEVNPPGLGGRGL